MFTLFSSLFAAVYTDNPLCHASAINYPANAPTIERTAEYFSPPRYLTRFYNKAHIHAQEVVSGAYR